jgi:hypothetical protein
MAVIFLGVASYTLAAADVAENSHKAQEAFNVLKRRDVGDIRKVNVLKKIFAGLSDLSGAEYKIKTWFGHISLLHVAAETSGETVLAWLVEHKLDVNEPEQGGRDQTPLAIALLNGRSTYKWLLAHGANPLKEVLCMHVPLGDLSFSTLHLTVVPVQQVPNTFLGKFLTFFPHYGFYTRATNLLLSEFIEQKRELPMVKPELPVGEINSDIAFLSSYGLSRPKYRSHNSMSYYNSMSYRALVVLRDTSLGDGGKIARLEKIFAGFSDLSGENFHIKTPNGHYSLLHAAAETSGTRVLAWLIAHGLPINEAVKGGLEQTALGIALLHEKETYKWLVDHGADLERCVVIHRSLGDLELNAFSLAQIPLQQDLAIKDSRSIRIIHAYAYRGFYRRASDFLNRFVENKK